MTCTHSTTARRAPPACGAAELEARFRTAWLRHVAGRVRAWIERRRTRDALAELDARLLEDVGLTRQEARTEAAKPFWRE
jgi:uncharacterized protein YjiS (DUF1127 family)